MGWDWLQRRYGILRVAQQLFDAVCDVISGAFDDCRQPNMLRCHVWLLTGAVRRPAVTLLNMPHGLQVTMVMTDVEGSTQLWEQDSAAADEAIALHDSILRGMLPTYFGFEVRGLQAGKRLACKCCLDTKRKGCCNPAAF